EQEATFLVRKALISAIDSAWKEHMEELDFLRHGIETGSRERPEWKPVHEYSVRGQRLFIEMIDSLKVRAGEGLNGLLNMGK
ncbi:hypothetical protein GTN66_06390, partial [bacterium]|nr:hypothetical protein [bacterium]NIO74026.1 hypothetical protein [bacterium]